MTIAATTIDARAVDDRAVDDRTLDATLDDIEVDPRVAYAIEDLRQSDLFDAPFGLNDAIVAPTAQLGRAAVVARIEQRTAALNRADGNLASGAERLGVRVLGTELPAHLQATIRTWKGHLEEHDNLRAIPHALAFLAELRSATPKRNLRDDLAAALNYIDTESCPASSSSIAQPFTRAVESSGPAIAPPWRPGTVLRR